MIHLGILCFLGGAAVAVLRSRKNAKSIPDSLPVLSHSTFEEGKANIHFPSVFDDVGELKHYQKVSWYSMAFTASGSLFYPPITILSSPLLGYSAFNFLRSLRNSSSHQRKSALTIFELIGVGATLYTGSLVMTSAVMLFAFGRRNLLIQAGNIANNLPPSAALRFQDKVHWVFREGVEVEVFGSQLQSSDILVYSAGDVIAIDGIIIDGEADIRQIGLNQKMKTVYKSVGDRVYPFTQLQNGSIKIEQKNK